MPAFEAVVSKIRAARYLDENTGRRKPYRVRPAASRKLRARIAGWAKGRLPEELEAFLDVTAGFEGAGITVNVADATTGPTGVLVAYDYGNGDCLGLDDEGDRCAVWWIGHDPYGVIFVAESLLDYVTRFAELAQQGESQDDERAMIRPEHDLEAVSLADARRRGPDPALDDVDEASVIFDFREARPRTHVDVSRFPRGSHVERHGRLLIAGTPKASPTADRDREVEYLVELAFGLVTMEQFDQARHALTRALQLDPSSQRARERMTWLEEQLAQRGR